MSRKGQNYNNRGFRKLVSTMAMMASFAGNMYNYMFHNKNRNTGKAGGHLHNSYVSGGGSGSHYSIPIAPHKAKIEKKRRRKEVDKSKRINRKRNAGVCSFK